MLASPRQQPFHLSGGGGEFMPSVSGALRGMFGGGIARCIDKCRAELTKSSIARHSSGAGVTPEASFRTAVTTGGSSIASGAATVRTSSKQKAR